MFEKLKNILVEELSINPDDITMTAELANDLHMDSLELWELVNHCESEFGIEFQDTDAQNFKTVSDVVEYLEANA